MTPRDFAFLEPEEKMLRTVFWVECSHSQSNDLWAAWSTEAHKMTITKASLRKASECDDWRQIGVGHFREVGEIDSRPVCISLHWFFIKGVPVCFYEATSRVVDWDMIEDHLKKFGRGKIVPGSNRVNYEDASNFHNAVFNIRDLVKYAAEDKYLFELSKSKIPALRHLVWNEIFVAEVKNARGTV